MSRSRLPRPVLCLAAVALAGAGCVEAAPDALPSPSPTGPDRMVAYQQLNESVAEIAEEQASLSPPMAQLLSSLRAIDSAVANLRDPERIDGAVDGWPPVSVALDEAPLEQVRVAARELAADVDTTRIELAHTRSSLDDEWERSYLDAQDLVLQEVHTYARTSDELAQVLAMHLPTYRQVMEDTSGFVEQRGLYRSAEEASDAYEVEIGGLLDDLSAARRQIARFVEQRDAAVLDVNAASGAAMEVWLARPGQGSSPRATSP